MHYTYITRVLDREVMGFTCFYFLYFAFNLRFIAYQDTYLFQDFMDFNTICLFIFLHNSQLTFYSNIAYSEMDRV
jgi:hypothetical protein